MSKNKAQPDNYRKKIQKYSFLLKDIIGKGYSSQVYNGKEDQTQLPVAIKVIDMKMLKSHFNRQLLQSQIQILKLLKEYENILHFNEVYTTKNNTYIVTQLCKSDLQKQIKNQSKLPESKAFDYLKQILQGYRHIYQLGIIHRDLKPANILINKNSILKIADFGFAIKIQKLKNPCTYNVGSPLYMSPEALKNSEYSFKSDVWSIGVILFEMLTGNTPWHAKYEKDLLLKIETKSIEQIMKGYDFSYITKQILNRCLQIQVEQRITPNELFRFIDVLNPTRNKSGLRTPKVGQAQKFNFALNKNWSGKNLVNNFIRQSNQGNQQPEKNNTTKQDINALLQTNKFISSIPNFTKKSRNDIANPANPEQINDIDNETKKRKIDQQTTQARSISKSFQKDIAAPLRDKNISQLSLKKDNGLKVETKPVRQSIETINQLHKNQLTNSVQQFHHKQEKINEQAQDKDQKSETNNKQILKGKQDEQKKMINRVMLSQVHLCRFMFKIIGKIRKSIKKGILPYNAYIVEKMFRSYCQIMRLKLQNIQKLPQNNFLEISSLDEYTKSTSFKNIEKLVKEYKVKYANDLNTYWRANSEPNSTDNNDNIETETTEQLIRNILSNLKQIIPIKVLFQERYSQDIIILDYLMTCKQLLELDSGNNYQLFAKKSRIDEIVEGNSSTISYDLYLKIKKKAEILLNIN